MNSNSASNHSTQSNNTTATTHIESASNHWSHHSIHNNNNSHSNIVTVNKRINAPQLANPLPPLKTDIVIPMDQQNYNVLLQQMYPQYNHTQYQTNPYSRHNYNQQTHMQGIVVFTCIFMHFFN